MIAKIILNANAMKNNHSHKTKEEEIECAVWFGECWRNPPKLDKKPASYSNKPSGSYTKDKRFD